ncbi:MAG TPA: tRNA (adenosine(37)-N6)-dimethylallyltransferase MiaA [Opitutaceae bacterium]
MSGTSRVLHVLTGCTAAGKTEWALRWAEERGAEILSCDSLLFYRGMDIGTAKPTRGELGRVPHHLVDIRAVCEPLNVAEYAQLALAAAEEILGRGRPVLVVGGSGFYLSCFFRPVADRLEVPLSVREEVARVAAGGLPALVAALQELNPGGLGALDAANPRRVEAALARCLATGRTHAELTREFAGTAGPFAGWKVRLCRLDRPPADIEGRIAARVAAMLAAGLVAEVESLLGAGLRSNPSACRAIGYRETIDVLEGRAPAASLAAEIERDTRALVKKQRTWFRTQLPPHPVVVAGGPPETGRLFP